MYLYSPVFGFWTMTTCENGSYNGYLSMTFSPFGRGFVAGAGSASSSCFFFLKLMLIFLFLRPVNDCFRLNGDNSSVLSELGFRIQSLLSITS